MNARDTRDGFSHRRDLLRWSACLAIALFAHVGGAIALLSNGSPADAGRAAPAVLLELAPMSGPPAVETTESIPGPLQTQTDATPTPEATDRVEESPPEPVKEAKEVAEIEPAREEPQKTEPDLPPVIEQKVAALTKEEMPDVPPAPQPEVAVAVPAPPPEQEPKPVPKPKVAEPQPNKHKEKKRMRTALATTAPVAGQESAQPSASAPGHAGPNSSALPSWKNMLAAHLQRHKRYPTEAQARGDQGTAMLRFTVDRNGNVVASGLAKSSGVPALDNETLALIRRASPLPAAPSDVAGTQFSFSVPIVFNMR